MSITPEYMSQSFKFYTHMLHNMDNVPSIGHVAAICVPFVIYTSMTFEIFRLETSNSTHISVYTFSMYIINIDIMLSILHLATIFCLLLNLCQPGEIFVT